MLCPTCRTDNAEHRKFCKECGTALQATCPSCGGTLEADDRFCGQCGAAVAAARPPAPVAAVPVQMTPVAERRVVSVLFADLVGFTPLSETRDAESVRELLSGYFEVARTVITRYGGTVEKFIGDAVMAVWGVPTTHEDDAERCVRAALELVDAVAEYGESSGASGLAARAGVVTGEVAVTLGMTGEGMVAGDAVNTASRVQAAAAAGGVFVDETTRQATSRAIGFADAGPHELKGKAEPVRLWRATRVVAAFGGSERVDGLEAGFLGRDRELRQVKDAFHETIDQRRARLVSVVGAAGVGKSRLRWELFKYGDGLVVDFLYHAGRCLPYGDGVAYWALAEMVRARLGISEEESGEQVAAKLDDGLHRWVTDDTDRAFLRPRLGALLGVAEPVLSREELFAGWRLWFERLADDQPVMLVLEDLQWADDGLLDFLEQLLDWSADYPIFIVTLSRPELLERRPTWGSGRRSALTVMLDPLSEPVMGELLDELVPDLPDQVRERIVTQADGIPLYAVELVRSLIDRDLVQPIDGVYRLVGSVDELEVPASLTSLVAARIDALPVEERALVQGLAVLGSTFPRGAAAAVTSQPSDAVDTMLADLVRREILRVRTDRLSPDRGQYAFTQGLLRQVAYDTLSRRDRKARHLAVATHLRATFADDGAEVAEVVAQHYLDAYDAMPDDADAEELRQQAATAFTRAGLRAMSVGAPQAAEHAFDTAATLTVDPLDRTGLLEQAGDAAFQAGRLEQALERYQAAADAHQTAGNLADLPRVKNRIGHTLSSLGRLDESIGVLRQSLELLADRGPCADAADAHSHLGGSLMFAGRQAEAASHVEAALALAEALGLPDILATAAIRRGLLLTTANRPQEALVDFEWAVALAARNGLGRQGALAHLNAGDVCLNNDLSSTEEHCRASIELARRRGERVYELVSIGNLSLRWMLEGRWDAAEENCSEPLKESTALPGAEYVQARLAELSARRGDVAAARARLATIAPWAESEDLQTRCTYASIAAAVALAAGDLTEALELDTKVVAEIAEGMGLRNDMFRIAWPDAMDSALALGRLDEAEALLAVVADRPAGQVPAYLHAQLARFRARLTAARDARADVAEDFLDAERRLADLGYLYWLARTRLDHAGWLVARDRAAEAGPLLAEAAAVFERLGAGRPLEQARRLTESIQSADATPSR